MVHPRLKDAKVLEMRATALPPTELSDVEVASYRTALEEAKGPPLITNGKPTVMRMTAWMCHEGINRNRLAFVKEELAVAAQQIGRPNVLVMDFNHSAIHGWMGEPACIGIWDTAEFAFDPKANGGNGAWGILVQGVMFAWLFPEIADALLAEQSRNGFINYSMACISGSDEFVQVADGESYMIAHNPVFFTNSALDVAPADPDARGLGSESADADLEQQQRTQLVQPAALVAAAEALNRTVVEDERMTEEMKAFLATLEASVAQQLTDLYATQTASINAQVATDLAAAQAELAARDLTIAERDTTITALTEQVTTLTATATELTEAQALAADAVDGLTERLATFEAAATAAQREVTLAARLALLPEAVRTKHLARDTAKREPLENKWVAMSEDDFTVYLDEELGIVTAAARPDSYLDRSNRDIVPAASGGSDAAVSIGERARRHIK